jgi:putative MATE family efflux protein
MGSVSQQAEQAPGFWASVGESLRGTEQDFTEGAIGRAVTLLAIPMVLEMSMESLFGIVDVFFVAKLGADAIATVGLTESLLSLVFGVAMGLSMATTAMVARRIGEKDREGASVSAVQAIWLGLIASAVIGVAGVVLARRLLEAMGASSAVLEAGWSYTAIILGGSIPVMLLFLIYGIFRGAGDAVTAMHVLWVSNGINIVLDPCLIFGWGPFPELGLTGAAIATTTGRGLGVVFQLVVLFRGRGRVAVRRRHIVLDGKVMRRLVRVALTGMAQFLVATASWLALVRIIAIFGSAALAGYTIALRVIIVAILPSWGMSNAAATLVGQNLGAGKPDRAERSVWLTAFYNMLFLGAVGVLFVLFAGPVIRLFTGDAAIIPFGVDCLRYVSYGYVFYAYGMVMVQAFNGAGDTTTPTIVNLFCYWLWQIPLAYVLALPLGLGPRGVFVAIAISESTLAVAGVLLFRRGRWKQQMI